MLYFSQNIWTFCRKASLPFAGKVDFWDCGITFDIFTHVFTRVVFLFYLLTIHDIIRNIQNGDLGDGYNDVISVNIKIKKMNEFT